MKKIFKHRKANLAALGIGVLSLMLLNSCSKYDLSSEDKLPAIPEGYVRTLVNIDIDPNEQVQTRATQAQEDAYDPYNIWVLVFDNSADPKLMQKPVKAIKSGTQYYALLRATGDARKIYATTGLTATMNNYLATASNFVEGTTPYSTLNNQLVTTAVTATGIIIGPTIYIPMCTPMMDYPTGTTTLNTINAQLKRIASKIDIDASSITNQFTLLGATLNNGASKGYVLPQATLPVNYESVIKYNEANTVSGGKITSQIYLYENSGKDKSGNPNPTTIIVRGNYMGTIGYYRLDIHKKDGTTGEIVPMDITRNTHFTVTITKIENIGYASYDEALNNAPSNIDYTVTVIDPSSSDITSNGSYYFGLSNSQFSIFTSRNTTISNERIFTLTTDAPSSVTTKTITVSGTGLDVIPNNLSWLPLDGKLQLLEFVATMTSAFTTGTITIKIGNLTKTVTVTRSTIDSHFDVKDLGPGYESAEMLSPVSWLTLSNNAVWKADEQKQRGALDKTKKTYIHVDEYIVDAEKIATRTASLRLFRNNNGSTVVKVEQLSANYLGYFGGDIVGSGTNGYPAKLYIEHVEEDGPMQWGFNSIVTSVTDKAWGLLGTRTLAGITDPRVSTHSAKYCYDKNRDTNGNGTIDPTEELWYLPAQNQLMAAWVSYGAVTTSFTASDYWSASEASASSSWYVSFYNGSTNNNSKTSNYRVRCVRDL